MSDYLGNMAAKALNLTEGLQPRLTSLFEPPSAAGRPIGARFSADGEAAPGEPFASGPPSEAPLPTQQSFNDKGQSHPPTTGLARPVTTLSQQPTDMADTSVDQPPGPPVNRQSSPLRTPRAVDTASGPLSTQPGPKPDWTISAATPALSLSPGVAEPPHAKPAQPSRLETSILVPVIAGQEAAAGLSTPTTQRESLSALEQILGRTVDERGIVLNAPQAESMTHPESAPDHVRPSSTPAMPVIRPHVTLYREPPVSIPSEGTAMPEPAPTIKITIGRVDVRAIMPTAPAPRPVRPKPNPTLSLEDYLRQRGGERR